MRVKGVTAKLTPYVEENILFKWLNHVYADNIKMNSKGLGLRP
jgi:hypothetical protein